MEIQKARQMAQREKRPEVREGCSVVSQRKYGQLVKSRMPRSCSKVHNPLFCASVDSTGSQPRMISERAKLHGIFEQAQRHSRDGRFFLLLGGSDQLVGWKKFHGFSCG